jgi:hypothetical protein
MECEKRLQRFSLEESRAPVLVLAGIVVTLTPISQVERPIPRPWDYSLDLAHPE